MRFTKKGIEGVEPTDKRQVFFDALTTGLLWYTRAALDWTLLYHVREWMSPGTLRRMERKMKKDFNQDMLISPSRHIRKGGGFLLGKRDRG